MRGSFVSSKETLGYPLTNLFTEDGVRGFILSGGNLAPEEIRTPAARFVILARTLQSLRTVTTTKQEWSKNRAKTPNGLRPPITATKPASVTFLEANDRRH
jgi:hypothetical protein